MGLAIILLVYVNVNMKLGDQNSRNGKTRTFRRGQGLLNFYTIKLANK